MSFRFYEIVRRWWTSRGARFTFLSDALSYGGAKVEISLGDGRLSLEADPPRDFDVLVLDAFSGDAIPVHLLTEEAFALILRHLKACGPAGDPYFKSISESGAGGPATR